MTKSVCFVAKKSGDGESFLWQGRAECDRIAVVGAAQHEIDRLDEEEYYDDASDCLPNAYPQGEKERFVAWNMLKIYPSDICNALGVEEGKYYKFSITVEDL